MISMVHLFKYLFIITLLLFSCQFQLTKCFGNNNEFNNIDIGEDLYETLPIQHHRLHQNFRRASLRYHPHVLYKKASLRPIIGQNGKVTFTT